MKYQALKGFKTKTKLLKMCNTLEEAHKVITEKGASFTEFNYYGGFPYYFDGKHSYTIQGAVEMGHGRHIVCSLDKEELQAFDFTK